MSTQQAMKGLSPDLINSLMAGSRTRNAYGPKLKEFMDSDEAAINVAEVWPVEFGGKKATTLYQGFRLAADKADIMDQVLIKMSDETVFILHKERCTLAITEAAEDTED
jgi:hypothetical protein